MKKFYLVTFAIVSGLFFVFKNINAAPYDIEETSNLGPTYSTGTLSGANTYVQISSQSASRICLFNFDITVGTSPLTNFPKLVILNGPLSGGTTIYNVSLSSAPNGILYYYEQRTRETSLCGDRSTPMTINVTNSSNSVVSINYQGYMRSRP